MESRLQDLRICIQANFREVMLIRGFEDLETFKKQYGIQDQITKEY